MRALRSGLIIAAAAAFGALTWSLAHLVTDALCAHAGSGAAPYIHIGDRVGPFLVPVAAFLATLITSICARSSPWHRGSRSESLIALAGPAAFLVFDWAEHLATGREASPGALIVIGVLVHAAMGAATPLLWNGFARRAVLSLPMSLPAARGSRGEAPARSPDRIWTPSRRPSGTSSRGPPASGTRRALLCLV